MMCPIYLGPMSLLHRHLLLSMVYETYIKYMYNIKFKHILGIISMFLGLKLEKSLLTSSIRCIVQLTIMVRIFIYFGIEHKKENPKQETKILGENS